MAAIFSCRDKVESTRPVRADITESVYASGYVKSVDQYEVFSSVNGVIREVHVKEGDVVRKGQRLATLVNETPRLAQENARLSAEYTTQEANKDRLRELESDIALARSKLENDSILLERQRHLWSQQIGSRYDLEQRTLAFDNAAAAYRAAVLRYSELEKQRDFQASQARKNFEISSRQLNDYTVQARIDGKVYSVLKEAGEMVTAQTPIALVGSDKDFVLELQVDEYDIGRIRTGQKVVLTMDSYKGRTFEAVVQKIYPLMNERSRTFEVEATFTKGPEVLYPNLTVEANVIILVKHGALIIPRGYLIGDTVVRLRDKKLKKVSIGVRDYKQAEVVSGLTKDDVIIKPAP